MTDFFNLIRIKVTILVGLSAFAGTCLFSSEITDKSFFGVLIAFFLSSGCSALNQWQERCSDFLMKRTKTRPIPSGNMQARTVLKIAFLLIFIAFVLIAYLGNWALMWVAIFSVIIYNFIYTPLKKKTAVALLFGSVSGALPPVIGFLAVGGSLFDRRIMVVSIILYIWQTPHFAMLSTKYAKEYSRAGFKTLIRTYGAFRTQKITDFWVYCYGISLFAAIPAGIYAHDIFVTLHILLASAVLILFFAFRGRAKRAFNILNISASLFFILLIVDRFI